MEKDDMKLGIGKVSSYRNVTPLPTEGLIKISKELKETNRLLRIIAEALDRAFPEQSCEKSVIDTICDNYNKGGKIRKMIRECEGKESRDRCSHRNAYTADGEWYCPDCAASDWNRDNNIL